MFISHDGRFSDHISCNTKKVIQFFFCNNVINRNRSLQVSPDEKSIFPFISSSNLYTYPSLSISINLHIYQYLFISISINLNPSPYLTSQVKAWLAFAVRRRRLYSTRSMAASYQPRHSAKRP